MTPRAAGSRAKEPTIFHAPITADRPHRAAMPPDKAFAIVGREVGNAVDRDCLDALRAVAKR